MIEVIIADDHAIVRSGLKQILSESHEMMVSAEATDGQDLLDKIRKKKYDVILLDISMPGRSGIEILKQIKIEYPAIPVLVLSMHPEEQYAKRIFKAGASGYIMKDTASEKLIAAIKKVSTGGKYLSSALAEKLATDLSFDDGRVPHEKLSDREYEVLCKIGSGMSVSQISAELFLSIKTISTYRSRILEKMGMKNNSELTHYAVKNNLVE